MNALNRDNLSCVPLWNQYKNSCWWYFIPTLSAMLIRALLLSFARVSSTISRFRLPSLEYLFLTFLVESWMGTISFFTDTRILCAGSNVNCETLQYEIYQRSKYLTSSYKSFDSRSFDRF